LKSSALNSILCISSIAKNFVREGSKFTSPGPISVFRPRLPPLVRWLQRECVNVPIARGSPRIGLFDQRGLRSGRSCMA
jgi:hypothetical protein